MAGAPPRPDEILAGLNDAQREAALAVTGPVAILAGAGTGKTTTITRRIACQVATGEFAANEILAVTFTDKAAGELRGRLAGLGVAGVEARTFHSAALAQLSRLWPLHAGRPLPDVLDHKAPIVAGLAAALPGAYRFVARRELAAEIEWAKNRLIPAERYLDALGDHVAPIPPDLMARVYAGYERRKRAMGRLDFEDMLGLAVDLFDRFPGAAADVRARYAAFTVDEFQDVNPLQVALLERWLDGRDELCVVGDDYQTIYTFTGASPRHLLEFRRRFPHARIIRLEDNYRSSPQVLEVANRLAPALGGFEKSLRATRPAGPDPTLRGFADADEETASVVVRIRGLHGQGVALEQMAILYRINARSEPFEEALAAAGLPFQVRDGAFLARSGPRAAIRRLRRESSTDVVAAVERATEALGFDPVADPDSDEEVTRQADLARLRSLAGEFGRAHPDAPVASFVEDLEARFAPERSGRGVNLLTYHRAKGLEFDAVFLPRLVDGELPFWSGRVRSDEREERRLLYVGVTRARRHLWISWHEGGRTRPSPFLREIGMPGRTGSGPGRSVASSPARAGPGPSPRPPASVGDGSLFDALRRWRLERARADDVPAYVVFHDATLRAIAERRPRSSVDLLALPGIGPAKVARYGEEVLQVVAAKD